MAIVTIHSDFGAQENKICHCFLFFPIYLPWSDGNQMPWSSSFWMLSFKLASSVKRLPTIRETWVWSLGQEDPLEKEMETHYSNLAWKIPWTKSLVGYIPWGCKESNTTERLHLLLSFFFFPLSFTFIKRFFSSLLSAFRVVSSTYLRLLIFLLAILIPTCVSSIPAFHMTYSAYKLNK